ncbi:TAF6-like RNA polymerase II p300/CBP-associated factor-associated factor 65 kDa subunit 6L [Pristis pectinata]|uniref:TAF6-like RNA polymerase II p300/CBP-associated factor-associated factor 65 kDa subunit 6L n=1 Tax=Pristis pectinata TaxID=685728 RepID=UPI00223E5F4B|nr:TAF6-like RNA polymerase II p300/CBP-associated factor-associated factor 65 kDa subunit 6L [Pristis pectinata]
MAEREERRFAEVPRESVKLMAESVGLELGDEVAALLSEDVCYRLREVAQNSAQFMKHAKRRRLTTEDVNRALRWANVEPVCGYGAPDALAFRSVKDGELFVPEDREVNLLELALATNIPKGCAETIVRVQVSYLDSKGNEEPQGVVPMAVSSLSDDLMKYYQQVTRAVLGDDRQLMKVALQDLQSNSKIAALLPYFVYVVSGVKSVSHDLDQLSRLLHIVKSLIRNPYLYLGSYIRSLVSSIMYCILEPLAASINPLNDHWTLRDYAALLLSHIFWWHGDLVSGLYHQILLTLQKVLVDPVRPLCSHYGALVGLRALGWKAVERVLYPQLSTYWPNLQAVLDDNSVSNAQVKADGHKVYGAILVAVERLLKAKARLVSPSDPGGDPLSPAGSPPRDPPPEFGFGLASHLLQAAPGAPPLHRPPPPPSSLPRLYCHLYSFFGDALSLRFGTGPALGPPSPSSPLAPAPSPGREGDASQPHPPSEGAEGGRKMPQLTLSLAVSPRQEGSPAPDPSAPRPPLHRPSLPPKPLASRPPQERGPSQLRGAQGVREAFQRSRLSPRSGHPSFLIAGRQMGHRVRGRLFQTSFPLYRGPSLASRYGQRLPMIGRVNKPVRKWLRTDYSLHLLL